MSLHIESKYYEAYFDHVLDKKKTEGSLGKVFDLLSDLTDRRGLRQEWEKIDGDIQSEIIDTWISIIDKK